MKNLLFIFMLVQMSLPHFAYSQTAILTAESGVHNPDLQSILYFEGINMERFSIKDPALSGKDFQVSAKEFIDGQLVKTDTLFNSLEDVYFRLKTDSLVFRVISKITESGKFKIRFQFNGFAVAREYQLSASEKDKFTLKDFLGRQKEKSLAIPGASYLLAFMPPYIRPDKSEAYCEVAQSGTDPEKLFDKYGLKHYYLIGISFN